MRRNRLCALAVAVVAYLAGLAAFALSFWAISAVVVSDVWHARDWWLLWFSVFTFLVGAVTGIFGTVWAASAVDGLCERKD